MSRLRSPRRTSPCSIFCLDDGPRILDCIEFDDHLRHGDVLADVAFLAMDLERLGAPEAAAEFPARYRETAGTLDSSVGQALDVALGV